MLSRTLIITPWTETAAIDMGSLRWHAVLASYKLGILLEGSNARAAAGRAPRDIGDTLHRTAIECLERAQAWIEGGPFA